MTRSEILDTLGTTFTRMPSGNFIDSFAYKMSLRDDGELVLTMQDKCRVTTRNGIITILESLESDGASIPKPLRWIAGDPFDFDWLRQAVLHDQLYRVIEGVKDFSRPECDLMFKDTLWNSKVNKFKTASFYKVVDWVGGSSYKTKTGLKL